MANAVERKKETIHNCIFFGQAMTIITTLTPGPLTAPACPYCRQRVTILLPFFSETEKHSAELEIVEKRVDLLTQIKTYNNRFSGAHWLPRLHNALLCHTNRSSNVVH
jgi:hypothetical protein